MEASRARGFGERLAAFAKVRPKDLTPEVPAIAEPSTGLTMGQSAEKMAKENHISREEQDQIAYDSHRHAAAATDGGAAVLLMSEARARAEGYEPLAFIKSWAVAAVDPGGQLLMGPALAVPK